MQGYVRPLAAAAGTASRHVMPYPAPQSHTSKVPDADLGSGDLTGDPSSDQSVPEDDYRPQRTLCNQLVAIRADSGAVAVMPSGRLAARIKSGSARFLSCQLADSLSLGS
jgi:hypothetical protein